LQKANELDQQKSGETIKHMIKTRNLVETKHMKKRADGEGENLQKLEERIQQQAVSNDVAHFLVLYTCTRP
jgi:hypothetical protein